jgi:type I restriction enzyme S subunit
MTNELKKMNDDWIETAIGNVSKIYNGNSINAKIKQEKYSNLSLGLNYIATKDVNFDGTINYQNGIKIPVNEPKFKVAPNGCVLVCSEGGSAGRKTAYVNENICFGNKLYAITNELGILRGKYVFYYTRYRGFFEDFKEQMNGIIGGVSARKFSLIEIPLAPLPIQRAIVSKIETLFSDLDNGISNLKKVQDQLKVYRQAVLKKAFEGEYLTNEEKKNRNIIQLGGVVEKPKYGTSKKCSEEPHGIAVLRIPNIGLGVVNSEILKYAEFDSKEISSLALKEGDILTIRSNGSIDLVGKCALITKNDTKYLYAGYLIRLRPNNSEIDSKYLLHCLNSHELRIQIESKAKSTSGVNNINSGELQSLYIPIFPLKEQHEIVREIESRLSVCDKIEESIVESLDKAEALRQSILKKAFDGKLLSKAEIEACKQESDYEPASELLKKIKKEK